GGRPLLRRLRGVGVALRARGPVRRAAVGRATADALRGYHLFPDLVPPAYRSEDLAEALRERVAGGRVLLARADRGREVLRERLAEVAAVEQVAVYSQVDAPEHDPEVLGRIRRGEGGFVTLASSHVARSLARGPGE